VSAEFVEAAWFSAPRHRAQYPTSAGRVTRWIS
jgi:hypothetical protein